MVHMSYGSKGSTPNQMFQALQECFLLESVTHFGVDFRIFIFPQMVKKTIYYTIIEICTHLQICCRFDLFNKKQKPH